MASRLQLELGVSLEAIQRLPVLTICSPGRDALARKAAKSENVNTFRTILFEDWLRLFMHVEFRLPSGDDRLADCL